MTELVQPPAIVIRWSDDDQMWLATAIDARTLSSITGSTGDGSTPVSAVTALMELRFCVADAEFFAGKLVAGKAD